MNINPISQNINKNPNIVKRALNGINDLGETTINLAKTAKKLVVQNTPKIIKENKNTVVGAGMLLLGISQFVRWIKAAHQSYNSVKDNGISALKNKKN